MNEYIELKQKSHEYTFDDVITLIASDITIFRVGSLPFHANRDYLLQRQRVKEEVIKLLDECVETHGSMQIMAEKIDAEKEYWEKQWRGER